MLGRLPAGAVSVQTSCAANRSSCLGLGLTVLPTVRLTVAVEPSLVTCCCTLVPGGSPVTVALASQGVLGPAVSEFTRPVSNCETVAPSGTNTESGTSTWSCGSKKYRSCAL